MILIYTFFYTLYAQLISDKREEEKENISCIPKTTGERGLTDQTTARTLSGVLNRLSNILDRRTSVSKKYCCLFDKLEKTPQAYKDSDFKQYWMPDSSCKECYDCGDKFTTFRRRHHCRICGQIFCSGIRVCTYCGKVAMSHLQAEPEGKLRVEREDLGLSLDSDSGIWGTHIQDLVGNAMTSSTNSTENLPFDVTPQSEYSCSDHFDTTDRKILEDLAQLRELWRQIIDIEKGVEMQNHRIRLRTYNRCLAGNKLVDWFMKNDKATHRLQGVAIGQALLDAGFLESIAGQPLIFHDDFTLYKPLENSPVDDLQSEMTGASNSSQHNTEPEWFKEIQTDDEIADYSASEENSERTDLIRSKSDGMTVSTGSKMSVRTDDPDFEPLPRQELPPSGVQEDIISDSMFTSSQTIPASKLTSMNRGWRYLEALKEENGEKKAYIRLKSAHEEHLRSLTNQLLSEAGLAKSWANIILGTAQRISFYVHPDVKREGDHMDVRKYVKFKKIPGGNKEQTCMIHGLVFTKNVTHKKMANQITNPNILLLKGSVEYQRVANKFSSLEPQILQEEEFLQKNVAKISSLKPKPDIVVVEKSVSRLAQNYLLKAGITLIYNVKMVTMEKLERFTQASIVSSIDGLVSGPITLGFCHNFKVCNFQLPSGETKTMLCFDGCATHLGCTVTLRGGTLSELKRLKSIMKTMVYASYHSQLEISFFMDEFALPVTNQDEPSVDDAEEEPVIKPNQKNIVLTYQNDDLNVSSPELHSKMDLDATMIGQLESGLDIAAYFEGRGEEVGNDMDIVSEHFSTASSGEEFIGSEKDLEKSTILGSEKVSQDSDNQEPKTRSPVVKDSVIKDPVVKDSVIKDPVVKDSVSKEVVTQDSFSKEIGSEEQKLDISVKNQSNFQEEQMYYEPQQSNSQNYPAQSTVECGASTVCSKDLQVESTAHSEDLHVRVESTAQIRVETPKVCNNDMETAIKSTCVTKQGFKSKGHSKQSSPMMIDDQSDPLYNYQKNQDETIFYCSQTMEEKKQKQCQKFKKGLSEVILSSSPYIQYGLPYLVTEEGAQCCNRKFFPEEVYRSTQFENQIRQQKKQKLDDSAVQPKISFTWSEVEVVDPHPFVTCQLISSVLDKNVQGMLADFRARGGQIKLKNMDRLGYMSKSDITEKQRKPTVTKRRSGEREQSPTKSHKKQDCFDFNGHQRLAVLLSSHSQKSANHPYPCLPPQVVPMEFYGSQDITLGGFLERFCFRESYSCQPYTCPSMSCDIPMLDHVRRIVHGNGAIYISLRRLPNIVPGGEKAIMMWNWCRKCRQATPLVPMSMDSWNISFAKYLELRFYGNCFIRRVGVDPCSHSLHQYYSQYFGHRNIVATFKYYPVSKKEVVLPPPIISLEELMQQTHCIRLKEEVRSITKKNTEMYSLLLETIMGIATETQSEAITKLTTDYKAFITTEKSRIRDLAETTNQKLQSIWLDLETNPGKDHSDKTSELYLIQDDIVRMKRLAADAIQNWNSKLQELYSQQKKSKVQNSKKERESNGSQPASLQEEDSKSVSSSPRYSIGEEMSSFTSIGSIPDMPFNTPGNSEPLPILESRLKESEYEASTESNVLSVTPGLEAGINTDSSGFTNLIAKSADSNYLLLQFSQESNKQKNEKFDPEMSQRDTELDPMVDDYVKPKTTVIKPVSNRVSALTSNVKKAGEDFLDSQQVDRISGIKKTLSNFWSGTGSAVLLPGDASEHHQLPVGKIPVLVYDHEASSIIAYALSCHDYHGKLQEIQTLLNGNQKESSSSGRGSKETETLSESVDPAKKSGGAGMLSFLRGTTSKEPSPKLQRKLETVDSVKYVPAIDTDSIEIDEQDGFSILSSGVSESDKSNKSGKPSTIPHIELQFSDQSSRFYCKVYFAEQFRQLRKLIFPAGEEMYIRSLSRCKIWEAKGGKSGSAFCKTDDSRFILKQMSGVEVDIFEKFGPEYFKYVSNCYLEQRPTALAKIVGVYKIGFRNSQTNNAMKQDLLVMENLFYNRKIAQTFDLKGSMRNRLVNTSGKREEELVLLDENLLKCNVDSPLYVYPHAKKVLSAAINRDSEFLSANLVMDYSLLVGFDEGRKELVVGIIDYIRTFTWDKKLETLFKSTGGKMPTVVSPEIYRNRFLEAIGMQYFLPVPDQWAGMGPETENL
ncbi:hypothetical protein FSP39_014286 [Pinctada imbricata]|uniref:1-phosphatidylinositol-3-phosphate 5-kinase n=1 Tax=Pinctada imbricata TaxID=66713 RepID=A0AA88XMC5_PINIB|nr:hypothetical protein FSP39_014286 [Pinctada imbricata]